MRIALLGAFPFPSPQGSQVYLRDQARALAKAGASVSVFCYGSGDGNPLSDLDLRRIPRSVSPVGLRSGFQFRKPMADGFLLDALVRAHADQPFDRVLAHNAEAALLGLAARRLGGAPVVYAVHTLVEEELASYFPAQFAPRARRFGRAIDRFLARRVDGILALSREAGEALARHSARPRVEIPPGCEVGVAPTPQEIGRACQQHALEPGRYVVYAGNLDAYQNLAALDRAAADLDAPVAVFSHDTSGARFDHLRVVQIDSAQKTRPLLYGSAVAVLPRRSAGGFPIKLLNYMEAGLPIVTRRHLSGGLVHDRTGWLIDPDSHPRALAEALRLLLGDAERAARLGAAARRQLASRHAWPELARHTLKFLRTLPINP